MKKLIYSILFVLATSFGFSQNTGQNSEVINTGRVIGSFDLGSQEITTIMDEISGCVRKSSPHSRGLFEPNETVEIILKNNEQMAEVRKPALPERVYANKSCNQQQEAMVINYSNGYKLNILPTSNKNSYDLLLTTSSNNVIELKSIYIAGKGNSSSKLIIKNKNGGVLSVNNDFDEIDNDDVIPANCDDLGPAGDGESFGDCFTRNWSNFCCDFLGCAAQISNPYGVAAAIGVVCLVTGIDDIDDNDDDDITISSIYVVKKSSQECIYGDCN